jgi:hypothetical protein
MDITEADIIRMKESLAGIYRTPDGNGESAAQTHRYAGHCPIIERVEGFFPGGIGDTDKPEFSGKTNKESELFTDRDAWAVGSAVVRGKASIT